ncbi:hypothetical protein C0J52_13895 [Blattella germanica]|nr:hypothetical protein C0J52_13895 [Blattella germanica]
MVCCVAAHPAYFSFPASPVSNWKTPWPGGNDGGCMEPGCPQQSSCRVVYLTMYLTAVILLAAYSATLISFLTIRSISLPFRNLEEILSIRTHKLGALKDSTMLHHFKQNSSGLQLYAEVYDHLLHERYGSLVRDTKTGLQRVCDEKYLLMAMYTDVVTHLPSLHCRVMTLPSNYFRSSLAFGFRLQSPYKPFINYHLQAMKDDGVLHKLRSHLEAPFKVHQNDLGESVSGWVSVEMEHLLPILTTLAAGIVLGASFLFLECAGRSVLFRHIWRVRFRRSPPFSPYRVLSHAKSQLLNA